MTITSPWACANPLVSAAALPKFRRSRTTLTFGCAECSRVSAAKLPSVEPSSTNTASHSAPTPSSAAASSPYRSSTLRSSL